MSFESTTLGILTGSASVTALVPAASIYFGTGPQDAAKPFIVCSRISTQPTKTHDVGSSGSGYIDNVLLQIGVYGGTYLDARTAADTIRAALEASRTTKYILTDQINAFDDFPNAHSQILTFSAWHQSVTP